ncbi:MAG: tsaD 2 [Firmicutes bacterium]|nr:tsaD 2 [Bacillota bacterium]
MKCTLGIDTSCYTTSVALFTEDKRFLSEARRILTVKPGGRGLAQSEMVYQHTRYLPDVLAKAIETAGKDIKINRIGVTVKPRPLANSFMPAFLVGESFAKTLALTHKAMLYPLSHQENHILAGLWSSGVAISDKFLAVHASGGTTEITAVTYNNSGMYVELLGGSIDIAAGQFIDRIGVAIGLPFPAGPQLEKLAGEAQCVPYPLPVAVQKGSISFAGPESHAQRALKNGESSVTIAAGVQVCVAKSLYKLIQFAVEQTGLKDILLVGGVGSNNFIRDYITKKLSAGGSRLYFPEAKFSSDNALGAAWFAACSS